MKRFFLLLLLLSAFLNISAIEASKTHHFRPKTSLMDFKKPTFQLPKTTSPESLISAAPGVASTTSGVASTTVSGNSSQKIVIADDGIIYVTAQKFAYVQKFQGDWFMSFFSDEMEDGDYFMFKFDFKNPDPDSPRGHYTSLDDLDLAYSYGHSESAQLDTIRYAKIDMTVEEDEEGALKMEGDMWSTRGQQYHYLITQPAPIKPDHEYNLEIVCDPKDCYLSNGETAFYGVDPEIGWGAQVAVRGLSGTFDKDHIMTDYTGIFFPQEPDKDPIAIVEQQAVTVTLTENKFFDVVATFVGTDHNRYNIHMTLELPEAGEPIDVKITNAQTSAFWGYFMTQGYNETYDAQASGVLAEGPVEDLSTFSAAVAYETEEDNVAGYSLFMHDATLSYDEKGQLIVNCSFYANDYKEYRLDMRYIVGEVKDEINIACDNCEYINALEKESAQRIQGYSNDGLYFVQITMLGTSETAGTFSIDNGDACGYVVDIVCQRQMYFLNGETVVSMDANGHITCTISADAMDIDVHHFNITLQTEWDTEYLQKKEYDATEGELTAAFYSTDEITQENYINDGGYLYMNIRSDERKELLTLVIYAVKKDKKIFIPEGTYAIDDTDEMYTVQASPGVYDGKVYPSYYATLSDDGYLNTPIWMLERGTLTVKNVNDQLVFNIDGINSYKRPIHITFNGGIEGIHQPSISRYYPTKRLENSRIVITKNNLRYDTRGVRMK